jgi:hypothetical protein
MDKRERRDTKKQEKKEEHRTEYVRASGPAVVATLHVRAPFVEQQCHEPCALILVLVLLQGACKK